MSNILDLLSFEERRYLRKVKTNKWEILFDEGDGCLEVGIVESGEVIVVTYTRDGGEIIYRRLTDGMMFGNNLIFSSDIAYKGNVMAVEISTIYLIKKYDLVKILQQNTPFLLEFLKYQSDMGKELNSQIKLLSIPNAEERFFYFAHLNNDEIRYKSITSLATSMFLKRETLSRLLSRLVKDNKILKKNKIIKILH